ncbi:MAG: tricarballylate utilization 4Fe-4S protein TcuB [Pikeienuella sp.]
MQNDLIDEARRQIEVCNACRYCENYCAVFPALHENRIFSIGDITQLANLCHNCRGCYYACQYTAPHEFDLNLPKALAEVRLDSWEELAYPRRAARLFQTNGLAVTIATVLGFATLFMVAGLVGGGGGEGFYAVLPHSAMIAIFIPAFVFPLLSIAFSLRRYWLETAGELVRPRHLIDAVKAIAKMRNLAGGHGDGCNFEDTDAFSHKRRIAHQMILFGFLLCFASTGAGTIMHYAFDMQAPYGLFSVPKLLGIPGGILLSVGVVWMVILKQQSDPDLGAKRAWSGENAFTILLGFVAFSGLALYALGGTALMSVLLALHLGSVLSFFLLMPFSKMAHSFYRMAALVRDAQRDG